MINYFSFVDGETQAGSTDLDQIFMPQYHDSVII